MEGGLQNKIENIQVLRFIAAFSVMMVHIPIIGFGIWGVDIFFVISGFIMMFTTEKNYKFFLLKRLIRIVPLYWLLTLGIFLIAILKPEYLNNTTADFEHLIKSMLFIPFNKNDIGHYPVLFLGWTLNYEIIFYLLFALTLIFFNKQKKLIVCSFLISLFILINYFLFEKNFIFKAYFNLIFFEFILGMIAYKIWFKFKNTITISLSKKIILTIVFLIFIYILNTIGLPRYISYGLPSFILILYFLFILNNIKFSKLFILLGDASYCIYLIHPYILQFFYKLFNLDSYSFLIQALFLIMISILVLFVSIIIFKLIEQPTIKSLRKLFNII